MYSYLWDTTLACLIYNTAALRLGGITLSLSGAVTNWVQADSSRADVSEPSASAHASERTMMEIKRVGFFQAAKVFLALALIFSMFLHLETLMDWLSLDPKPRADEVLSEIGWAVWGALRVWALVMVWVLVYNLVARWVGGIVVELAEFPEPSGES